jgi:hypothetical protein
MQVWCVVAPSLFINSYRRCIGASLLHVYDLHEPRSVQLAPLRFPETSVTLPIDTASRLRRRLYSFMAKFKIRRVLADFQNILPFYCMVNAPVIHTGVKLGVPLWENWRAWWWLKCELGTEGEIIEGWWQLHGEEPVICALHQIRLENWVRNEYTF